MNNMRRTVLLITVITAAMMELIDTSIVNVALSHMSGNLGATLEDTSWVITSYAIANVSLQIQKVANQNFSAIRKQPPSCSYASSPHMHPYSTEHVPAVLAPTLTAFQVWEEFQHLWHGSRLVGGNSWFPNQLTTARVTTHEERLGSRVMHLGQDPAVHAVPPKRGWCQ